MPGNAAPRASMPPPCRSSSIRICGYEWPTCGPATNSGRPVAERERPTSSAFDICRRADGVPAPGTSGWKLPSSSTTSPRRRAQRGAVREPPRHRDGRRGVLRVAQVVPHRVAGGAAEPVAERVEEEGAAALVAAADAEDRADERGDGDDVVPRPRRDPVAGARVERVDPRHVRVDVGDDAASAGALGAQERDLRREPRLGLRRGRERGRRVGEREGVEAGDVERRDPARPAQQVHQQPAVLGGRPARAEHDVAPRSARDVRDVPAVAPDRDPGPRPHGAHDAAVGAEPRRLEEALEVGRAHVALLRA